MRSGAASALAPPAQRARPSVRPSPLRPSSHPPTAAAARVARRARLCALASTGAAAQGEPAVVAPPLSPATTAALPPPPPPLPSVSVDSFLGLVVHGVPWRPLAAWSLFLATALVLHDFLGLAAATFVLSYLGNSAVSLGPPGRRRALASAFFAALLLLCAAFALVTLPAVAREGAALGARAAAEGPYAVAGEKLRAALGDGLTAHLERALSLVTAVSATNPPPQPDALLATLAAASAGPESSAAAAGRGAALARALQSALRQHTSAALAAAASAAAAASKSALQAVLAIVLSFVLVFDLPAVAASVGRLRATRLGWAYSEVAPACAAFGATFGRALQAQCLVAVANTVLTAAGMAALQIPGAAFLSLLVFVCSFIPVAGVLISTVPIGYVALTEFGVARLAAVVAMVLAAHAVEAYALNPAIYAAHLKLHPALVLSVLVVAEHSLGVWGLLLAVPLTVFVRQYVLKPPQQQLQQQ